MKREYFGILFFVIVLLMMYLSDYFLGEEKFLYYLGRLAFIWLILGFYIGQYSMRFPKAF